MDRTATELEEIAPLAASLATLGVTAFSAISSSQRIFSRLLYPQRALAERTRLRSSTQNPTYLSKGLTSAFRLIMTYLWRGPP